MRPVVLILLALVGCRSTSIAPRPLRVAAAADLQRAFPDLQVAFGKDSGSVVVASFGSTGLLAHQISQGAPFDLFCAASGEFIDRLIEKGQVDPSSRAAYARGQLTLWTPPGAQELGGLPMLREASMRRVALANPEHAPYGRAARQALERSGLWGELAGRLLFAENVRQAMQYAETGNADAALVAQSLVLGVGGHQTLVPEALFDPLDQVLGVVRGGDEAGARALARFLQGAAGQAILRRHGFLPPPPKGL